MGLQNEKIAALSFVTADLNYLSPGLDRPRTFTFEPPSGEPRSNIVPEPHSLPVHDIRPIGETVSLDREGFALVRQNSEVNDFYDEDKVRSVYYPEAERLIKAATGADRVFVFDHTVRKRVQGAADRDGGLRQPVARVHVDHTERSGPQRVRDLIPDEAEELLKGRVQIINLWRPIRGPLLDSPLAVCDARTVRPNELVAADLVFPNRVGETYSVKYNPDHQWFYVPKMTADEVLLLKCFDSRPTDAPALRPIARSSIRPHRPMRRRARALNCAPWCFTGIKAQERGPASDAGPLPLAWNQPRQFDPADAAVKLRSTALLTSSVLARMPYRVARSEAS